MKSTFGFGLDSSVDIFSIPPILTADATTIEEQAKVVKYRAAIEAVAALADLVARDSSASDTPQEIFDALTEDLKDGTIDGLNDTTSVTTLAVLDTPIDTTLGSLDPATLVIPNTSTSITDSFGTQTRNYLAAIDSSGNVTSWDPNVSSGATVNAIAVSGSMVYVGRGFTEFGGTYTRNRIAAFDTGSATPDVPTDWDPNANAIVSAIAASGSTVYAGGFFTSFGSSGEYARSRLAAFDTSSLTASVPTDRAPSADAPVSAVAVSGGTVYVGGNFTSIDDGSGAQERPYLAAIGTDGVLDVTNWIPSVDNVVYAIAVSGSTVYVGGAFTAIDDNHGTSQTQDGIAAIGIDGLLSSWNPNAGFKVNDLEASDSSVYVGGTLLNGGGTQGYYSSLAP